MKTGQMLFVAVGGIMLGAAGTLAIQTGLVHYEVSLDIRPRTTVVPAPLDAPQLSADPYSGAPIAPSQGWHTQPGPYPVEPQPANELSLEAAPLDKQQVAEIVSLREQLNLPASQKLDELTQSTEEQPSASFATHLRRATSTDASLPPADNSSLAPSAPSGSAPALAPPAASDPEFVPPQSTPVQDGLRVNGGLIEPAQLR